MNPRDFEFDSFEEARTAHEEKLKTEINKKLPDVKKTLSEMKDAKTPIKDNVEKLVAGIDAAVGGSGDLEQAVKDVEEVVKQLAELKQVYDIRKRIEDKWDINKDDEARKIVDELQKGGKLAGLPIELLDTIAHEMGHKY